MLDGHPLVLGLRSAGLQDVDPSNVDEMHDIWSAFSKAKNCIDGGYRYEYISWRIYSRELLRLKNYNETIFVNPDTTSQEKEEPFQESSDSDTTSEFEWDDTIAEYSPSSMGSLPGCVAKPASSDLGSNGGDNRQIDPVKGRCTDQKSINTSAFKSIHPMRRISSIELQDMFKEIPVSDEFRTVMNTRESQTYPTTNPGHDSLVEENNKGGISVTIPRKTASASASGSKRDRNNSRVGKLHNKKINAANLCRGCFKSSRTQIHNRPQGVKNYSEGESLDTVEPSCEIGKSDNGIGPADAKNKGSVLNTTAESHSEVRSEDSGLGSTGDRTKSSGVNQSHLPIIRGFDTKQISVSVNRRSVPDVHDSIKPLADAREKTQIPGPMREIECVASDSNDRDLDHENPTKSNNSKRSSRQNMFFIGAAESDSEVSPFNTPSSSNMFCKTPNDTNCDPIVDKGTIGTVTEEDWDDISEDEDEKTSTQQLSHVESEEHMKSLFKERNVPNSPCLKRSLLSSMFLDKLKQNKSIPEDSLPCSVDESSENPISKADKSYNGTSAKRPEKDLGTNIDTRYLFPKFRMRSSPQTVESMSTTKWQGGRSTCDDHQKQSHGNKSRQALLRTRSMITGGATQSKSPIGSQTNITARPEILRASSTTKFDTLPTHDGYFKNDWSKLHEDIYDPMNYHSRGW